MMRYTPFSDSGDGWEELEGFSQCRIWEGTALHLGPHARIVEDWYDGLLTIEEGQRIEAGRQVWQPYFRAEVK